VGRGRDLQGYLVGPAANGQSTHYPHLKNQWW
jgi:hypothetical protein